MKNGDSPHLLANGDSHASGAPSIRAATDIAHALAAGMENGGLLLDEAQLGANFFDLRTGLAAEVLQRFTNYRVRLAIVVLDANVHGSRFRELVHEHRNHDAVRFFTAPQLARQWLAYNPVVRC
jgi:hypothetical protein